MFLAKRVNHMVTAAFWKWVSTSCQLFFVLDLGNLTGNCLQTSKGEVLTTFKLKNNATCSLSHLDNYPQNSINSISSCILGNPTCNWVQSCIHEILNPLSGESVVACTLPHSENVRQWRVNHIWSSILVNPIVAMWLWLIYNVVEAFSTDTLHDIYITSSWRLASPERLQYLVLHIWWSSLCADSWAQNNTIYSLYRQKYNEQ